MVMAPILFILFTACFKFGAFSSNLKVAKVISIFKSGEKSQVINYKSISIISCFLTVLEKAVAKVT